MLICLDFDGTYTEDADFWDTFIHQAKMRGYRVICATMRHEDTEGQLVKDAIGHLCDDIIFTARQAKRLYLESQGIYPDIWIDDKPYWIENDSA